MNKRFHFNGAIDIIILFIILIIRQLLLYRYDLFLLFLISNLRYNIFCYYIKELL